ncbi:MAG: hypothetical protein ACYS32_08620 [Planctomycetota bacterium]|jgi:hypothetical protein
MRILYIASSFIMLFTCIVHAAGDRQAENLWTLSFQDDFERAELGSDWTSNDAVISKGRMLFGSNRPACAKITKAFPADVRIEFDAEAFEGKPPCDLSVTLAAERLSAMSWNYLLAFGGENNTVNKIIGGRKLKAVRDKNPKKLIEPKRKYHIVAAKEGKRLSLVLDGELLLEGHDDQIMGGPGFDAVGLVTWNGMYVDNVRVYERVEPHPYTPHYILNLKGLCLSTDQGGKLRTSIKASPQVARAVLAYNNGNLNKAKKIFQTLSGENKAAGLAYVYGNLYYEEEPNDFAYLDGLFSKLHEQYPKDQRLIEYAWAASLFSRVRIFPRDPKACSLLMALGPKDNPFYDKAKLYRARFLRASGLEGGDRKKIATARAMFEELKSKASRHIVLRELTGEQIPWGKELINNDPDTPRWAALLHEMYVRQLKVLKWWFEVRQREDGQLGGGWGDDVEILRSWGPFASISNAEPLITDGIEKLCQGVWDNVLVGGFDAGYGDVEHSAEPSADTVPTMLAIKYGNPIWFERNLASCRRIRDFYTGIDAKGYVRFKSAFFGGDRAGTHIREGGDNYYSSRPMKHLLWASWYGDIAARDFYLNWVEGWLDATMTQKYNKIAGIIPANIWYPSGDIAPPNGAPWNDPYYNYMGCCNLSNYWMQDTFLSAYKLSDKNKFLQPFHTFMAWQQSEMPKGSKKFPDLDEDPLGWAISQAKGGLNSNTLAQYRWLTQDNSYDKLIIERLWPAQKFQLTGDHVSFLKKVEGVLQRLRLNFNLQTREVIQTDRAGLAGSSLSFGAYTGGVREWKDAGMPTMAVTWDVPHADFSALVVGATPKELCVWLYNHRSEQMKAGMCLWQLLPGEYEVRYGPIRRDTSKKHQGSKSTIEKFILKERAGRYELDIPSRREIVIEFQLVKALKRQEPLPDPAICADDITIVDINEKHTTLKLAVHNLGSAPVRELPVVIISGLQGKKRVLARTVIDILPESKDLQPSKVSITLSKITLSPGLKVIIDPDHKIKEICELNNEVSIMYTEQ